MSTTRRHFSGDAVESQRFSTTIPRSGAAGGIDLEAGNEAVEEEVTLTAVAANADWRFAPRWIATFGAALRFDDDSQRTRLTAASSMS